MKRYVGELTILLSLGHLGVGAILYASALGEIGRNGIIAAVPDFGDATTAFWFMAFGIMLAWIGQLARNHQQETGKLPNQFGWQLIAIGLIGGLMMPISGFWWAIGLGYLALRFSAETPTLQTA